MENKICCECNLKLPISEFNKNKSKKDGLSHNCKNCRKKYRENNKPKIKFYNDNRDKEKIKKNNSDYRKKNYEKVLEIDKISGKKYRDKNKEKIKIYRKKYYKKNSHIKIWRDVLKRTCRRMGQPKESHTIDMLGYSATDLKTHIESLFTEGMSWDNYGEWHIDHIKMLSEFEKNSLPNIVNALSNLRPLWSTTREINGIIYEGNLNRKKYYRV